MKNRKAVAFIMVLAMIFCYIPPATYAIDQPIEFLDMPQEGFWSTQALGAAVNNGLLQGFEKPEGYYIKPNDTLTRAQMATIVNRAFGAKEKAELTGTTDVPERAWYTEEIQKAVKMGTMKLDQKMRPNDPITRQEAFTVLARAFRATGGTAEDLAGFKDAGLVASWALDGMGSLVQDGYIKGSGDKLSPKNNITRAEFAVIMDNMVKQYIKVAGTVTDVVSEGNVVVNVPGATIKDVTIAGDLIIGDGVGDGNITLDNVTVQGDLIARGGGVNSIIIVGGSVDGKIIISKVDGQIRVSVEGGAEVEVIVIDDGQDDVILEGTIGTVEITVAETPVIVRNATIQQVTIAPSAIGASLEVTGTVSNLTVQGQGATVTAQSGGTITNVTTQSDGVTITGTGNVGTVIVEGNNTAINTANTAVTIKQGVENTTIDDEVQDTPIQDTTVNTNPPARPVGGGGGTPAPTVLVEEIEVTASAVEITVDNGQLSMTAAVSPAAATNKNVTWEVDGTAATINSSGLLTAITNGAVTVFAVAQDGSSVSGQLEITISGQVPDIVDYPTISGIDAPVKGDRPDTSITETDQFTGTISWSPDHSPFGSSTSYTATVTLTAKDGYTLAGIANDFFIVPGATTVSSVGNTVTAQYPVTDPPEYSTTGALAVDSITVTYGATSAEALGRLGALIPTVSVSGTLDGESGTATITWISITGYNGTSAGAYIATGTLTLPADWTGTPVNVTAMVNVSPAELDTISRLDTTEVWITYGATSVQAIALLDASVGVTGTLHESGTATITWDILEYVATSAGAYTATGTLTLPSSWIGTGQVTATVNVSPAAYASTDALAPNSVSVTYGATSAEALGLLQATVPTVGVNGTNLEEGTATITWTTIAAYDATSPGAYQASGTLVLPASWSGSPDAVTAAVIVLPVEYISTEALTTPAIWVTYGATSADAIALLDTQAVVNGTNSQQATVNITWTEITGYNGTSAGAYEAIGELAIPGSWIVTGDQPTVSAIVNVSPAAFAEADELATTRIYVTYGATSIQAIGLLDTSVGITGTLGESGTATITWDIPLYSGETGGINYLAIGTLTLSNSWTYVGDQPTVSAIVTVSPAAYASTDALIVTSVPVTYGATSSEAILLLDDEVGITGTNGERGTATIIWDIPGYVATSSGAYESVGTLNLPIGWSGTPDTVTAAVIVLPVEYISTEALTTPAIWVTYGATSAEAIALLDTQAVVNGTNSEQATVNITWISITDYNGTSAGAYTATGTLALPDDWTGTPGNVTATVNVSPVAYASADVLTAASIYVTYGATSAQAIALLDASVGITGTLGERGTADIDWDIPGYVAISAGAYTATGTLVLPNSWTGGDTVTATVNVSPAAYASTDALAVTSVSVTYGTAEAEALGLLQSTVPTVEVSGTNGEEGTATITWTTIAAYDATSPGSYVASGTLALPASWSGSPGNVTAAVIVLTTDLSGFDLSLDEGCPTIAGIMFGLYISNAALYSGESVSEEAIGVSVGSVQGYLGSFRDGDGDKYGGTEGDRLLNMQVDFNSGEAMIPIFINTEGAVTLTVTVSGVTTSESITLVFDESQADIVPTQAAVFNNVSPGYITISSIIDASGNERITDFTAENSLEQFELSLHFYDGETTTEVPNSVTKQAVSSAVAIMDPTGLTVGGYVLVIDMQDGNRWEVEVGVMSSESGFSPDQLMLGVQFGSIVVDMTIMDGAEELTWGAISESIDLANSYIQISSSTGSENPVEITFGALTTLGKLSEEDNTITFAGSPGLGPDKTEDFADSGIMGGFVPFEHDIVYVNLQGEGWNVTGQAFVPYLDITASPGAANSLSLTLEYRDGTPLPALTAVEPTSSLISSFQTDYASALANKVTVAAMDGGGHLYAFIMPAMEGVTLEDINSLIIGYDSGTASINVSGTRTSGSTASAMLVLFLLDGQTGTVESVVIKLSGEGDGTVLEVTCPPMVENIEDEGGNLFIEFSTDMDSTSVETTGNYMLFEDSMMTTPIAISLISYDSDSTTANLTLSGVSSLADGAFLIVGAGSGIQDAYGFELETMGYTKSGEEWDSGNGGGGDNLELYKEPDRLIQEDTFSIGDGVAVHIDDAFDFSEGSATIPVRVTSDIDSTGITIYAIESEGLENANHFWTAFSLTSEASTETSPYAIQVTAGGTFTVSFGSYVKSGNIEDSSGQAPDALFMDIEFGSMILNLDPKEGGAEGQSLSMAAINVDLDSSYVEFSCSQSENPDFQVSFSAIDGDTNGEIRLDNNQIYLSGSSLDLETTGIFSESGLLSQLNENYDTVYVELAGTSSEGTYAVTSSAVIPSLYLSPTALSGSSLDMQLIINYDLNPTQAYSNVTLSGTIYDPMVTGAALAAMESVSPYAITGDDTTSDRIQAYYISPVIDDGEMLSTLNNIDYFVMSYDAGSDTATLRVDLADPDTGTASAIIHLMLVDTLLGNINIITLEIIKDEGQPIEIGEPGGSDPEWFANISSPTGQASWPMVDGAEAYDLKVYKDYVTSADAIVTEMAIASGDFSGTYELGEVLVTEFAGDGTYYAGVLVSGGEMDGTFIEPRLDPGDGIAISRHANITGVYIAEGSLYWDTPDPNDGIRVDVYLDDVFVTSSGVLTDAGETGYLIVDNLFEGSTTEGAYRLELTAAGSYENGASDYTRLPSMTPEAVTFNNADPTGSSSPYVTTVLAGETFEGNAYASGDAIRLYFNEPITFGGLTMEELVLSDGCTWGETDMQNLAFGGDTEIFFSQYGDSFVITLASGASVVSGATITVSPGALEDVLGNVNSEAIVYTVVGPDIDLTVQEVGTYDALISEVDQLDTSGIQTIRLTDNIVTDGAIIIPTIVAIDFNNYQLTAANLYITTTAVGEISLSGPGVLSGDLTIDAPNATFINSVEVTGNTVIHAIGYESFYSSGLHGGNIAILGQARIHLSEAATAAGVGINTTDLVLLDGTIQGVQLLAAGSKAKVFGTVGNITVLEGSGGSLIEAYSGSTIYQTVANADTLLMVEPGATIGSTAGAVLDNVAYRVSFDKNGGDTQVSPTYLLWDNNSATSNPMPTPPTKSGHTFNGWNSAGNGTGDSMTTAYGVTAPMTAYAVWATSDIEITGYEALEDISGGERNNPDHISSTEAITYLEEHVTCASISGYSAVVPIGGWVDTDTYDGYSVGSYTFTATVGTPLPDGFVDDVDPITNVTVEIVISEVSPPTIVEILAAEGGAFETGIGPGDTIAVRFNKNTNMTPGALLTKADIDSMITLQAHDPALTLGTSYSGYWFDATKFVIDIHDSEGNFATGYSITINSGANIKSSDGLSPATTDSSIVVGSFDPEGLYGTVRDRSGNPLENIEVEVYMTGEGTLSVFTNSSGQYSMPSLPDGEIRLGFFNDYYYYPNYIFDTSPGTYNVVMDTAGIITGTIVLDGPNAPVTIPEVTFASFTDLENMEVEVESNGDFTITGVKATTSDFTRYLYFYFSESNSGYRYGEDITIADSQPDIQNSALAGDTGTHVIRVDVTANGTIDIGTIHLDYTAPVYP